MQQHRHNKLAASMFVAAPSETIFPLLCPVREYEWIEQWQCTMLHSHSGMAEEGCVFQTILPDMPEVPFADTAAARTDTWIVCRYAPPTEIAFVRCNGHRAILYSITLQPQPEGTRLTWSQQLTALTPQGNSLVHATTKDDFCLLIRRLELMLNHFCATGNRLSAQDTARKLAQQTG